PRLRAGAWPGRLLVGHEGQAAGQRAVRRRRRGRAGTAAGCAARRLAHAAGPPAGSVSPVPVTLFLMTRKGLAVLDAVVNRYGPSAVGRVVGAADPAVERDYAAEIRDLAAKYAIPYTERTGFAGPEPDGYCLAVGWRWLVRGT